MDSKAKKRPAAERDSDEHYRRFRSLIAEGEDQLIDIIGIYARRHEYTKYTSTLREAWRASIAGLNESLLLGLERYGKVPELHPDENYAEDPIAAFGVLEAKRHRERGVRLDMFLGLLKYYKQTYHDLVHAGNLDSEEKAFGHLFVERFYDRIELGFLMEWTGRSSEELIEELQTTNRRITNEKNKYLTIFESISDPVILLNEEGQLENLNHAANTLLLGDRDPGAYYYGERDIVGLFPWLPDVLGRYDAQSGEQTFDLDIQTTKGLRRYEGKLAQMLDISERYSGTVVILGDVTERERAREELQEANQKLEQRVAERSAELEKAHEQLLHSQKLDAVGTLAGGVAHDLNNLLQVIGGCSELLEMELGGGEGVVPNLVDQITHASDRATSLVRQLLLFSRKQPMELKTLDINRIVEDLAKMLRRIIGENIEVELLLSSDLRMVEGDVGSIEQVLMNLVVNARDALPHGGKVTIRTENAGFREDDDKFPGVEPGEYILLTVEDDGVGMDHNVQQHIFEPFFSTKAREEGTGLGLSVVYGIVQKHEGWINVYSEVGIGTTFKVYLPVASEAAADTVDARVSLTQLRGDGQCLLLVEDEDVVRSFIVAVLSENGYEVHAAANAEEGLALYEELGGRVDCVISDVILPGRSGAQMVDEILQRSPEQQVLFISGYTAHATLWSKMEERGFRLLPKPFTLHELLEGVRDVVAE